MPGNFAGAAIFSKVTIIGSRGTIIDKGNSVLFPEDAFDIISPGADGTTIRNMTFIGGDIAWGVFAFDADDVTVSNCVFLNTFHAVDIQSGNGWKVTGNVVDGLVPFAPPGQGFENHQDAIVVVAPARDNYIADNWIRHVGERNPGFTVELNIGIILASFGGAPLENNIVEDNEVEIFVPEAEASTGIALIAFDDPISVVNNFIIGNDLEDSLEPIFIDPGSLREFNVIEDNDLGDDDDDDGDDDDDDDDDDD